MLPDLAPHHALAITTCLLCLLAIIAAGHWVDGRARRREAEQAADRAQTPSHPLLDDDEPGFTVMTCTEFETAARDFRTMERAAAARGIRIQPPSAYEEQLRRLARLRAARKANPPQSTHPKRAHPVPEPDIAALRADPFKAYSRRAHVLFPASDEPSKARPPKPWHIGDNPSEPQQ